jgi:hypothetical protein
MERCLRETEREGWRVQRLRETEGVRVSVMLSIYIL